MLSFPITTLLSLLKLRASLVRLSSSLLRMLARSTIEGFKMAFPFPFEAFGITFKAWLSFLRQDKFKIDFWKRNFFFIVNFKIKRFFLNSFKKLLQCFFARKKLRWSPFLRVFGKRTCDSKVQGFNPTSRHNIPSWHKVAFFFWSHQNAYRFC